MLEQKSYSVEKLFGENILFRIPDYQRGYAWEKKQLDEFWEDVSDCLSNCKMHYFGTLFLEKQENEDFYRIIDGQQRLTTLIIFLYVLINTFSSKKQKCYYSKYIMFNNEYRFSYLDAEERIRFFNSRILSNYNSNPWSKDVYEKNLWFAKKYFDSKISAIENKEEVLEILTKNLTFNVQIMTTDFDAQAIFETLNNRGKPLTVLEKLKNRLIYLDLKKSNGKLRNEINLVWKEIYRNLGENKKTPLDENEFISAHLTIYRKPIHEVFSEIGAERKLFQMFCNHPEKFEQDEDKDVDSKWINDNYEIEWTEEEPKNPETEIDSDGKKIQEYIENLKDFCIAWKSILNPDCNTDIVKKILILSPTKATKTFLSSVYMVFGEEKAEEIFYMTEQILFRQSIPEYAAWCKTEENFTTLARWINKNDNDEEFIDYEDLKSYFTKALDEKEYPIESENIVEGFRSCFDYQRGNKGFYRWSALQYFLFEYEDFLRVTPNTKQHLINLDNYHEYSIEHIIPQKCVDDYSDWEDVIRKINPSKSGPRGTDGYKKKSRIIVINTLGNLTLLKTKKEQQIVGSKSWKEKKKLYKNESKITSNYNFREILSFENDWGVENIRKRGAKMIDFLGMKLDIKFNKDQKERMLFYDINRF